MLSTAMISILALLLGKFIKSKVYVFRKYYIPSPVIGGIIFAIIIMILNITNLVSFKFDTTIQTIAMTLFFTSVGFMANIKDLKKGGIGVIVFVVIVTLLIILQNIIGISISSLFHVNKLYGLLTGSISLTGGHGTTSAWANSIENYGALNGGIIGYASATYGLVVGGLIGGPVAHYLFKRNKKKITNEDTNQLLDNQSINKLDFNKTSMIILVLISCAGLAELLNPYFIKLLHLVNKNLTLPSYILSMLFATIFRNAYEGICDKKGLLEKLPIYENEKIGDISLQIFLAIALTTLDLSTLTRIDTNVILMFIITLFVQTIFIILFVIIVTFNVMKNKLVLHNDYDAMVICAGHCGFGLGATPTAVANMDAFCKVNGTSTKAYLIVPIVGAMFVDFVNAIVISVFIGFLI